MKKQIYQIRKSWKWALVPLYFVLAFMVFYLFFSYTRRISQSMEATELAASIIKGGMPAAAIATLALTLLALLFYNAFHGFWDWSVLFLMFCALMQCLYYLGSYENISSAEYVFSIPLPVLFAPSFVYLPILFFVSHMKKHLRLCTILFLSLIVPALIPSFAAFVRIDIGIWHHLLFLLFYPVMILLFLFALLEFSDGNPVFRIFVPHFCISVSCIALLCLFLLENKILSQSALFYAFLHPERLMYWFGTLLFLLATAVCLILTTKKAVDMKIDLEILSSKNDLMYESLELTKESAKELAVLRHNLLHHLTILSELAKTGDNEHILEYLENFIRKTERISPLQFTSHTTINGILAAMYRRAKGEGVELQIHANVPAVLTIPDLDLGIFLMNLLDNAIREAGAKPKGSKRLVAFTMHVRNRYLFIEAENTWEKLPDLDLEEGLPRSHHGEGRGYGLKSMQAIARKYQSELQIEAKDHTFLVRTALLMPEA